MSRHVGPMRRDSDAADRPELDSLIHRARHELRAWTDTADTDPGMALQELLAVVGDLLTSHSERLAGEAYLGSAHRERTVGARNEFEVEVDGEPWRQVTDFAGSAAEDRHYLVSRRADGVSVIEFGDGVHGQRPQPGSSIGVRHRPGGAYSSVLRQQGRVVLDSDENEESSGTKCGLYGAVVLENADPLGQRRLLVQIPEISGDESVWAAACLPVPGAKEVPAVGEGVWIALESCDPSRPIWLGQRVID